MAHERLATVAIGENRAAHVRAAREAWLSIDLPDQADRIARNFA